METIKTDAQKRAQAEAERERNKVLLQKEINKSIIPTFSFEAFKKTKEEKERLKELKTNHNARLRTYFGAKWKRNFNVPFS